MDYLLHNLRTGEAHLLDPLRTAVFCVDPDQRATNMARQIAVTKTLWDLSCTLRGRRFRELLTHVYPGESATGRL